MIRFAALSLVLLCALAAPTESLAQKRVASIDIGGVSYSNVVVESVSAKTLTFSHARGIGSINPNKLAVEQKQALGLAVPTPLSVVKVKAPESERPGSPLAVMSSFTPASARALAPASVRAFAKIAGAF